MNYCELLEIRGGGLQNPEDPLATGLEYKPQSTISTPLRSSYALLSWTVYRRQWV